MVQRAVIGVILIFAAMTLIGATPLGDRADLVPLAGALQEEPTPTADDGADAAGEQPLTREERRNRRRNQDPAETPAAADEPAADEPAADAPVVAEPDPAQPTGEEPEPTGADGNQGRNRNRQADEEPTVDRDCIEFPFQEDAQAVLDEDPSDPFNLDPTDDGFACSLLPSRSGGTGAVTAVPSVGSGPAPIATGGAIAFVTILSLGQPIGLLAWSHRRRLALARR